MQNADLLEFFDAVEELSYSKVERIVPDDYLSDKTPGLEGRSFGLIIPQTPETVGQVIRLANLHGVPLVVRGAGTGKSGGAVPLDGDVVLSLELLNRIHEVDVANCMVSVESGVILSDLKRSVAEAGLWYPPDPASETTCSIGGNVAVNAGGPSCLKYGVTGDYVVGLKGFFPTGESFSLGGKLRKNVAGFDLIKLLVGSEGVLGVITEITLRLVSPSSASQDVLYMADTMDEAMTIVQSVCTRYQPVLAEYWTKECVDSVFNCKGKNVSIPQTPVYVVFRFEGDHHNAVLDQINRLVSTEGVVDKWKTDLDWDVLWDCRKNISPALTELGGMKRSEDVTVPPASIGEMMLFLGCLNDQSPLKIIGYGHLGDGNIHVNVLKMDLPDSEWESVSMDVMSQVVNEAIRLGGTITGEHGVGVSKKRFMSTQFDEKTLGLMRAIKHAFDPNRILGRGKIL